MNIIEINLMHNNNNTVHPFLCFLYNCEHFWDDYYCKNDKTCFNMLKCNKYYRILTIKNANINIKAREKLWLDYKFNNGILVKVQI